jgi:hypothetical protein
VLAHRFTLEHQTIAVVHEAIEDGIGEGAIAEEGVPLIDGKLARDEGGAAIVTIVEDLEQVAHALIGERSEREVIEYQQVCFGELTEERGALLHGAVAGEFLDETWQAEAAHGEVGAAGGVCERGGDEALADAGRAGQENVEVLTDPPSGVAARSGSDQLSFESDDGGTKRRMSLDANDRSKWPRDLQFLPKRSVTGKVLVYTDGTVTAYYFVSRDGRVEYVDLFTS